MALQTQIAFDFDTVQQQPLPPQKPVAKKEVVTALPETIAVVKKKSARGRMSL